MTDLIPILVCVLCAVLILKVTKKVVKIGLAVVALSALVVWFIPNFIL